ncbi:MAG: ATP-dependent Clp protease ATP-binding subunit [Prevotella sp.]
MRLECRIVYPEHLLLALLRLNESIVIDVLKDNNIDIREMKMQLDGIFRKTAVTTSFEENFRAEDIILAENASNLLKLSVLEARLQRTDKVDETHLVLAILHDNADNNAKIILEQYNITYELMKNALIHNNKVNDGIGLPDSDFEENAASQGGGKYSSSNSATGAATTNGTQTNSSTPVLDSFGVDLSKAASEGKLDPIVGREKEINRVIEILGRRKKNNPILIGEPGVGKSAIVEGLAQLIAKKRTSPLLFNKRIVSLDLAGIVAGTKYRGQFEERIKALIRELENNPQVIVFIDEIHTLVGAGSAPGSMDAANILKPALARGTIQCIGATTLDEYRKSIEKDGALERRFQKILVEPTSIEETYTILNNIKERYESFHQVIYSDAALNACIRLTDRYMTDRQFPDKAIDALDEVGSHVHLASVETPPEVVQKEQELAEVLQKKNAAVMAQDFKLAATCRAEQLSIEAEIDRLNDLWQDTRLSIKEQITEDAVAEVVSVMTGVPMESIKKGENERLRDLGNVLKKHVIAQDKAIDKIVKAIQRNRIGLRDRNHPIGVFMFLGPTGVGKTYLAKKIAEQLFGSKDALIRIDMSEFTESFNVSRLVGAPPGYVGYDEGGQLTEKVRRHPYSIVLLDELEKAHGNVFNLLLQVLDEGRLTDGNGRLVDFRNTIIIMTSNAGTRQLKEFGNGIGFNAMALSDRMDENDKKHARNIVQKALSKQFAPEFLNRLDDIITFDQLDLDAIKQIVDIELKAVFARANELGYHLQITDAAKDFIAGKGYDVQFGARPLKRAIRDYIEDPLCEKIMNGEVSEGDTLNIDYSADKGIVFLHV